MPSNSNHAILMIKQAITHFYTLLFLFTIVIQYTFHTATISSLAYNPHYPSRALFASTNSCLATESAKKGLKKQPTRMTQMYGLAMMNMCRHMLTYNVRT